MAGWLAWNLRIVTGVAIALCGYYGADYWSNKDTQRNIERINYQEPQEPEDEIIVKPLELGPKKPSVARERFKKMNNGKGGTVSGLDELLKALDSSCEKDPQGTMNSSDLSTRRYCRLYWSVKENIDQIVKAENKHVLLTTEKEAWQTKWREYQKSSKPWGNFGAVNGEVPQAFKNKCEEKSKESVLDVDDNEYQQVINYCSRNKTIKDVLSEKKFELLETGDNANTTKIWKDRFSEYEVATIGVQFHKDIRKGDKESGYTRLQKACEETIKLETTVDDYKNVLGVVEKYCIKTK